MSKHYVISELNRCTGCTACQTACASEAISMIEDPDQRYGYVAVIDEDKCIGCGKCGRICPVLSPSENQNSSSPDTFVLSADADTLRESASGGAFSLLARYILRNGGAVVGALVDFIGAILMPTGAYFPGFTVTAAITGLVFGLLLYKKINFPRIVIAVLSTQLVCGLLLNTLFISILYTKAFTALLATRAIQFVVMSVVEIIFAELALDRAKLLQKVKLA